MKDRRRKKNWWENIHQYKGERIPPYEPLSHLLPLDSFSPLPRRERVRVRVDNKGAKPLITPTIGGNTPL